MGGCVCVFACVCDCWVLTLLVLSNEGLHAESVQINVIIPQLLLIRVINAQCKQETLSLRLSISRSLLFLEWL